MDPTGLAPDSACRGSPEINFGLDRMVLGASWSAPTA